MIPVASLRSRIAAEAANCPNPVLDRALIDAARALCNAAPIWRDTIAVRATRDGDELVLSAATETIYDVPEARFARTLPVAYALIQSIDSRQYDGIDRQHSAGEMVRVIEPGIEVAGRPFHDYRLTGPQTVHIGRDPGAPLTVHVSVRPEHGAETLPDVVGADYERGVLAGALSRVLRQNGQPWASFDLATYYDREARQARNQAIYAATRGFQQGGLRAEPRRFATFRSRRWI